MSLMSLTAVELGKKIKSGEVKVKDAVLDAFAQIEAVEENINSYVTVLNKEEILKKAEEVQKKIDAGKSDEVVRWPRRCRTQARDL
mgnify:CR=1 FL=1